MIEYPIRRSDRARRARIDVSADGVEVVVPRRMALRQVVPFVEEKRPWIERTLRRIREAEEAAAVRLADGGTVPYLGQTLSLRVHVQPERVRDFVSTTGDVVDVFVGSPGPDAGWASRAPMSVSVGEESDGAVSAVETVLPWTWGVSEPPAGLLGELGTGSSR